MKDVDTTYEDSWPMVVGGSVMIPDSEKAIHHCMTMHIREPCQVCLGSRGMQAVSGEG